LGLGRRLVKRRSEIAALVTADMGKTLIDADMEVGRGVEPVESAAAALHLPERGEPRGRCGGARRGDDSPTGGVVAAIAPFNFRGDDPLWFLPYAIAPCWAVSLLGIEAT
jgi:malonate-semialdehyde dehydrogenase (acetylating)/methylmalonate-semialdehyde dehydrogenase